VPVIEETQTKRHTHIHENSWPGTSMASFCPCLTARGWMGMDGDKPQKTGWKQKSQRVWCAKRLTAIPSQVVKLIDMTGDFSACLVQTRQSESNDKDLHALGHRAEQRPGHQTLDFSILSQRKYRFRSAVSLSAWRCRYNCKGTWSSKL